MIITVSVDSRDEIKESFLLDYDKEEPESGSGIPKFVNYLCA